MGVYSEQGIISLPKIAKERRKEGRKERRSRRDKSRIRKQSCEEGLECFKLASREVASALSRLEYRTAKKEKGFPLQVHGKDSPRLASPSSRRRRRRRSQTEVSGFLSSIYRLCQLIASYRGKPPSFESRVSSPLERPPPDICLYDHRYDRYIYASRALLAFPTGIR